MATTSTIPTVKSKIIETLRARSALEDVHVTYAWNGPEMEAESIYLDPPDAPQTGQSRIPTLKAGRKARQETFTITVVVQVDQPDEDANGGAATEARAYTLMAEVENMLADDPGIAAVVGSTGVFTFNDHTRVLTPLDKGWRCRLEQSVTCEVRLS